MTQLAVQFKGDWRADFLYDRGDVVIRRGQSFVATEPTMWWQKPGTREGGTVWQPVGRDGPA